MTSDLPLWMRLRARWRKWRDPLWGRPCGCDDYRCINFSVWVRRHGIPAPPPRQPDRALRGYIEQANAAREER